MDLNPTHPPEATLSKNTTQMISLMVGFGLFVLGLCGLLFPAFAGLHMSVIHSLIISTAGVILFYNGYIDNSWKSFLCCLGFGLFFGVHTIVGFILGRPGVPTIGYTKMDLYFLPIIPGFSELGRADHILNGIIAIVLLGGAFDWFGRHSERTVKRRLRPHYPYQRRKHA